jgi:hypothetical protein
MKLSQPLTRTHASLKIPSQAVKFISLLLSAKEHALAPFPSPMLMQTKTQPPPAKKKKESFSSFPHNSREAIRQFESFLPRQGWR